MAHGGESNDRLISEASEGLVDQEVPSYPTVVVKAGVPPKTNASVCVPDVPELPPVYGLLVTLVQEDPLYSSAFESCPGSIPPEITAAVSVPAPAALYLGVFIALPLHDFLPYEHQSHHQDNVPLVYLLSSP